MPDNVAITAGTGTGIATDYVGTVHYQQVKLDAGGDGVSIPVVAGAGLPVQVEGGSAVITNGTVKATGSVVVTTGTIAVLPPVTGSVVVTVGTISSMPAVTGFVGVSSGTISSLPAITGAVSVTTNGTIANIQGGSVVVTAGTIAAHAITNVAAGSIIVTAGTISVLPTISLGTSANNIGAVDSPITTPTVYIATLTTATTEYTQALPTNCRMFEFQCQSENTVRFAFTTGKVAIPTSPYMTLKAGDFYSSPQIYQAATPGTLYLASDTAAVKVEILTWN